MTSIKTLFVSSCGWAALVASVFLLVPSRTEAGVTITARSVSLADVQFAVNSAVNGETVVVPAGTGRWVSTLNITKGITLRGATTVDTSTAMGTANDQTIILDDGSPPAQIVVMTLTANQVFRMTGFTFRRGTNTTGNGQGITASGVCPGASGTGSFRIDHCHLDNLARNVGIHTGGWLYGVIDHCIFYGTGYGVSVAHDRWGTYTGNPYGDGSWADLPYFGSNKFVFIEDNCFNNPTTNGDTAGTDAKSGGRKVIRYNHFNNAVPTTHGTEAQRPRGTRVMEVYNNTINYTFNYPGHQLRSGTAVIHHNTYTGLINGVMSLQAYRSFQNFGIPYGGASGINGWDSNDPQGAYATGTHTGANSSQTVADSTKNWTVNQWVPSGVSYEVVNRRTGLNSFIKSNTSNTLTIAQNSSQYVLFNTGDGYTIYKLLVALDQPGRGKGNLVSGDNPTPTWPNQALEPVYAWNNTVRGAQANIGGSGTILANRDYYNNTPMPGYTPYTYPHPLVSTGTSPAPPTNLRVISGQ
jgi:hypothetical protein